MITHVAVVPCPPLLVPELAVGADQETRQLRCACLSAVSSLADSAAEWVAVGTDRYAPSEFGPATQGTFAGYGADVRVALGDVDPGDEGQPGDGRAGVDPLVPLPVLIAGWLRARAGAHRVTAHLLPTGAPVRECAAFGARLARERAGEPVGLLVLADGSSCRDERSPHPPDERAEPFDREVTRALAAADVSGLTGLDPDLAAELGVTGRAALQALAGAVRSEGAEWEGDLRYSETPFGITYHVAVWSRT